MYSSLKNLLLLFGFLILIGLASCNNRALGKWIPEDGSTHEFVEFRRDGTFTLGVFSYSGEAGMNTFVGYYSYDNPVVKMWFDEHEPFTARIRDKVLTWSDGGVYKKVDLSDPNP
jgi:hypothetical protein